MPIILTEKEKKVVQYIKDYRAKGYSDKKITEALKKSNVDEITIKRCMSFLSPFYKRPLFWLGIFMLILGIALLVYILLPQAECSSNIDCPKGYDCINGDCKLLTDENECETDYDCPTDYACSFGSCVFIGEVSECSSNLDCGYGYKCVNNECIEKSAEPQCGDGECNIGEEDCVIDCGCYTNEQCKELGYDYCSIDGACMHYSGGSGGGSSGGSSGGTTSCTTGDLGCTCNSDGTCNSPYKCNVDNVCVVCTNDFDCSPGYACEESAGTCFELTACSNNIDDDSDGLVDYFGGCDLGTDGRMDMICGCWNGLTFSSYGDEDITCTGTESYVCQHLDNSVVESLSCTDVHGIYYDSDPGCDDIEDDDESNTVITNGCFDNDDCDSGYVCTDGSCVPGEEVCDNGIDDDNDDLIDCDDEDCVGDDLCPSGQIEDCTNGIDDNDDGLVDCDDSDCIDDSACITEICNNYVDDDGDNLVDTTGGCDTDADGLIEQICGCYDETNSVFASYSDGGSNCNLAGYDNGCVDIVTDVFSENVCEPGGDIDGTYYGADDACITLIEDCTNLIDDDADGLVDCDDSDCVNSWNCEEMPWEEEVCDDGYDNDQDGLIDCEDDICFDDPACVEEEVPEEEEVIYQCNDGDDNDNDGLRDYYGACKISMYVNLMAAPSNEGFYQYVSCSEFVVDTGILTRVGLAKICKEVCVEEDGEYFSYDTNCDSYEDNREASDPIVGPIINLEEDNNPLNLDAYTPYEAKVDEYIKIQPEETQQEGYIHGEYVKNLNRFIRAPSIGNLWDAINSFLFNAF